jgi:hypothetical protein
LPIMPAATADEDRCVRQLSGLRSLITRLLGIRYVCRRPWSWYQTNLMTAGPNKA